MNHLCALLCPIVFNYQYIMHKGRQQIAGTEVLIVIDDSYIKSMKY